MVPSPVVTSILILLQTSFLPSWVSGEKLRAAILHAPRTVFSFPSGSV